MTFQTLAVIAIIVVLLGAPVIVLLRSRAGLGRLPTEIGHAYLEPYSEITGLADMPEHPHPEEELPL